MQRNDRKNAFITCLLILAMFGVCRSVVGSGFPIFPQMTYSGMPNLAEQGFSRMKMVYASALWPGGHDRGEPHEQRVRAVARDLPTDVPVVLDVEHWSTDLEQIEQTIDKLIQIVVWIKDENPDVKLGYYMLMPVREYWPVVNAEQFPGQHEKWKQRNRRMSRLAEHVDYIFPSLYTFYQDQPGWLKYARESILEARQYGKPVYVFLWPRYHGSNQEVGGQFIEPDFWQQQLITAGTLGDGAVIWDWAPNTEFNPDWPWWKKTVQVLNSPVAALIGD